MTETKNPTPPQHLSSVEIHLLERLAIVAEARLDDSLNHIRRVGNFSMLMAHQLGFSNEQAHLIGQAAKLHDIGMSTVPATILDKTTSLTHSEIKTIRSHTTTGLRLVGRKSTPLIQTARLIISNHHERWDGSGYPAGITGNKIPIEARIVALADTFDAICSPRPYRRPVKPETAFSLITAGGDTIFDPEVLEAFAAVKSKVMAECRGRPHR